MFWSFSSPFHDIENLRKQMNEVFQQYNTQPHFPALDIYDESDAVEIRVEIPGFKREDINILLDNGVLHLEGKRSTQADTENWTTLRKERHQDSFERKIQLSTELDTEKLSAELKQGLLTIKLPKAARAQAKHIAIQ